MTFHPFDFDGQALQARATGALFWPERRWLIVADLHLGKSERMARRGGALLPPYETLETLHRLQARDRRRPIPRWSSAWGTGLTTTRRARRCPIAVCDRAAHDGPGPALDLGQRQPRPGAICPRLPGDTAQTCMTA